MTHRCTGRFIQGFRHVFAAQRQNTLFPRRISAQTHFVSLRSTALQPGRTTVDRRKELERFHGNFNENQTMSLMKRAPSLYNIRTGRSSRLCRNGLLERERVLLKLYRSQAETKTMGNIFEKVRKRRASVYNTATGRHVNANREARASAARDCEDSVPIVCRNETINDTIASLRRGGQLGYSINSLGFE